MAKPIVYKPKSIIYKHHWFWKHGVMVKVPPHTPDIKPKRKGMPSAESMPATPKGFQPIRLLINLKMVETALPKKAVTTFTPHIIIRVRYYQEDLDEAKKRGRKLDLGYWDGKQWVRFTGVQYFWDAKKKKGWAEVMLTSLIDPPLALGT